MKAPEKRKIHQNEIGSKLRLSFHFVTVFESVKTKEKKFSSVSIFYTVHTRSISEFCCVSSNCDTYFMIRRCGVNKNGKINIFFLLKIY